MSLSKPRPCQQVPAPCFRRPAPGAADCGHTFPLGASPVLGVSLSCATLQGLGQSPARLLLWLSPWRAEKSPGHLWLFFGLEGAFRMLGSAWVSFEGEDQLALNILAICRAEGRSLTLPLELPMVWFGYLVLATAPE